MRFARTTILSLTATILSFTQNAKAQIVSSDAFLQGNFAEAGVNPNGSFGSANDAPAGYHPQLR